MAKQQAGAARSVSRSQSKTAVFRTGAVLLLCIGILFGTVLTAVSVRGELLKKKIQFVYSGILQDECLFDLTIDADLARQKVQDMKRHGQIRKFSFFCNDALSPDPTNGNCMIMFGNPDTNDCILVLSIMDENGNLLYRSGGVEPGKYISQIRLAPNVLSAAKSYRAYVSAYDRDGYSCIGVQYTTLTVQSGGES